MIRSLLVSIALVATLLAPRADAAETDYTDTWWSPSEAGWGVNLTQQRNTIYVTFYIYGTDGNPTWYAALLTRDGTGERFTGTLNRTTGTYFAVPWLGYTIAPAGTATFTATSSTTGQLQYSVGGANVVKDLERITLSPLNVAGTYMGGVSGRRTGCGAESGPIIDPIQLQVLHSTSNNEIRIDQLSLSGALVCRMEGVAVQTGKVMTVNSASYTCIDGWNARARVFNLRSTPAGFEAQWFSDRGGGCTESGQLSGVTQSP